MNTLNEERPCGCAQVGPLLTAPGTSGRNWYCQSCGKVWMGAIEALAEARKEWAQGASCFCSLLLNHELHEFCITDRANEIQKAAQSDMLDKSREMAQSLAAQDAFYRTHDRTLECDS